MSCDGIAGQADRAETTLFDGIDTSIEGLARFVEGPAPSNLAAGLAAIARHAREAGARFERDRAPAVVEPLVEGLDAVRSLRADLAAIVLNEAARFEIEQRLATKQDQFEEALLFIHAPVPVVPTAKLAWSSLAPLVALLDSVFHEREHAIDDGVDRHICRVDVNSALDERERRRGAGLV